MNWPLQPRERGRIAGLGSDRYFKGGEVLSQAGTQGKASVISMVKLRLVIVML